MPTIETTEGPLWRRRTPLKQWLIWGGWLVGLCIAVYAWQLISEKTIWMFVWDAPRQIADIGERMVPPDWSYMPKLWRPVWDTLNRYYRHRYRNVSCCANCISRRSQYYTSQICSCRNAIHHCSNSVGKFANLGSSSGCDCWTRCIGRNDRDWNSVNRWLC